MNYSIKKIEKLEESTKKTSIYKIHYKEKACHPIVVSVKKSSAERENLFDVSAYVMENQYVTTWGRVRATYNIMNDDTLGKAELARLFNVHWEEIDHAAIGKVVGKRMTKKELDWVCKLVA